MFPAFAFYVYDHSLITKARFLRALAISHRSLRRACRDRNTERLFELVSSRFITEHNTQCPVREVTHKMVLSETKALARRVVYARLTDLTDGRTEGGRPLHPPSADENEMRGTRSTRVCVYVCGCVCARARCVRVCVYTSVRDGKNYRVKVKSNHTHTKVN